MIGSAVYRKSSVVKGARVGVVVAIASLAVLGCGDGDNARSDVRATSCEPVRSVQAEWLRARKGAGDDDRPTDLQRLADNLVECDTLQGMRMAEVRQLLGTPDPEGYTRQGFHWSYFLGRERSSISIDSEWLAVGFTPDGVVTRTAVYAD